MSETRISISCPRRRRTHRRPPAHDRPRARLACRPGKIQTFSFVLMFFCASFVAAAEHGWTLSSLEHRLEYEIKAAFLYQFGSYVDWPAGTFDTDQAPLRIGVLADDAVFELLTDIVRHRTVQGRAVEVVRLDSRDDPSRLHMLFIGAGQHSEKTREVLERVRAHPVLTVVDAGVFADGIIRFVIEQDRVRFDIALDRAGESGIRISSRLLGVARRVQEGDS